jgi:carbon monoxide dehydrogenase subunit G
MDLDSSFSVNAPISRVWEVLMDFDRVASSVPGAEILNKLSDDAFQVGMKVKLGPVALQYKGLVNVVEIDAAAHRAIFGGKAQETRGQGTIDGSATLTLTEEAGTTTGSVHADLSVSGKAAAMGKSVINSVTQQLMGLFAENLQAMVLEDATSGSDESLQSDVTDVADAPATTPPVATAPASAAPASAAPSPTTPSPTAPGHTASATRPAPIPIRRAAPAGVAADNSLDALSLVRGIVTDQLSSPGKLAALLAIVGFIGYLIGRATGRGARR